MLVITDRFSKAMNHASSQCFVNGEQIIQAVLVSQACVGFVFLWIS